LSPRIVKISYIADNLVLTIAVPFVASLVVCSYVFSNNPNAMKIITAVSITIDSLVAFCPIKSKILDTKKKRSREC
jgi:hypothetical protein